MKEAQMSFTLRAKIGEDLNELTGEELAMFLDYEHQRCEQYGKSIIECESAHILVAEAMKRSNENHKEYLRNMGYHPEVGKDGKTWWYRGHGAVQFD